MERRLWQYAIVLVAGVVGYSAPFVALTLTAWFTNGWTVAVENLQRVVQIHRELSPNTILAFIPNLALAFLVAMATIKCLDSNAVQRIWWVLGCSTVVGYVVVLYSASRWNLIPWTWSSELSNAVRSALTLMFPVGVLLLAAFNRRRTKHFTSALDGGMPNGRSDARTR
jgi:hypothetical protein